MALISHSHMGTCPTGYRFPVAFEEANAPPGMTTPRSSVTVHCMVRQNTGSIQIEFPAIAGQRCRVNASRVGVMTARAPVQPGSCRSMAAAFLFPSIIIARFLQAPDGLPC
jgi:hypothetical protein